MILILNDDGSLYYASKSEYVNQHSNNVNYIDFAFTGLTNENYTTDIYCELPNKTHVILQGETNLFTCNDVEYQGFRTYLTDATTIYAGALKLIVRTYDANDNVLYSYPLTININATSSIEDEVNISNTEYQQLLSKLNNYLTKYDSHLIRKYDSLALANAEIASIPTNGYVLIDGVNYSLFKKVDGAFVEVLNSIENVEGLNAILDTFATDVKAQGDAFYLINRENSAIGSNLYSLTINGKKAVASSNPGEINVLTAEDLKATTNLNYLNLSVADFTYSTINFFSGENVLYNWIYSTEENVITFKNSFTDISGNQSEKSSTLKIAKVNNNNLVNVDNVYIDYPKYSETTNILSIINVKNDTQQDIDLNTFFLKTDLNNYYTKEEVQKLHADMKNASMQVVSELPTTGEEGIVYLVKNDKDIYIQYVYENDEWINLGEFGVYLEDYYTKEEVDTKDTTLDNKITSLVSTVNSNYSTLENAIESEETTRTTNDNALQSQIDTKANSSDVYTSSEIDTKLTSINSAINTINNTLLTKQDKLIAGTNIEISEDNTISTTQLSILDLTR